MISEADRELLAKRQRPLTVDQYHRMRDAGVFLDEERLELLHGVLIARGQQSVPHAYIIQRLTGLFVRGVGEGFDVRVQLPLTVSDDSEPEPDFAIVRHGHYRDGPYHPRSALLVIEVSRSRVNFDRRIKGPLYARADIPEYWLVDVDGRRIEVRREPDVKAGVYRSEQILGPDDALSPLLLPGPKLTGRELLAGSRADIRDPSGENR